MINTIFYFADTENEYMEKYNLGEVSSRTIAFVKDSNKIFIDGHDYIDRQSVIDQLVADSQQKDLALADTIRQELAAAQATLESSISDANDYAEGVHDDLQGFKTEIAQDLSDSITAAITNANGRTIWTELATTNEGLTAATNRINVALDANGNVKYTSALQSVINTGIDNNTAFTNIANRYAVLNENQDIISWMTSGFKGHTNDTESFAAMYAAANEATQSAIAQVKTEVTTDAAGKYVAKAGFATEVLNVIDEAVRTNSLSYVASKSDVSGAESRMGAQYTTLNNALGTTNTTLSEVKTTAEEGKARASLLTSAGPNGGYIINESTLESSMVSIFNKAGDASTFIQQKANAAKDSAVATATTLINTQASNAAATYATKTSLNDVNTTLASYLKDANGNIIKSASLQESIDENAANISLLASDLENGTAAGLVSKAGLDEAVNGLLASNSNAGTKSTIQQMANNAAASTDITARMKNALGVDALNKIAQKSYVTDEIGSATTSILSTVDTKIASAKSGLATETYVTNNISSAKTDVLSQVDTKIASAKAGLATEAYVNSGISTAKNDLKAEICDANGKPKGVADLEQTVSDKIGENGSITTAITNLQTSVSTANTNASSALTQLALVDGKISTAVSGLKSEICDSNGKPKGVASLEQSVTTAQSTADANTTAINSLSTSVNGSIATLTQNVNSNGQAIQTLLTSVSGINNSIATITQDVSENSSKINQLTETVNGFTGDINTSEIITESTLDGAIAGMMAKSSSRGKSAIESSIVATVNASGSAINLSADKIDFTTTSASFSGAVQAVDITASALAIKNSNNIITTALNSDGSGWIANDGTSKGMEWSTNGGLQLNQKFLASLFAALGNGATNSLEYKGITDKIYGSTYYGTKLIENFPFAVSKKQEDEDFMKLYTSYVESIKDNFKQTVGTTGETVYKFPKGFYDGERLVNMDNSFFSKKAKNFIDFNIDDADPTYKPDIAYGTVIINPINYGGADLYPISGTTNDKTNWYFNHVHTPCLSFDRGLLTSLDPVDVTYKKTKANLLATEIDNLVYQEVDIWSDYSKISKHMNRMFDRIQNGEDLNTKYEVGSYKSDGYVFKFKEMVASSDYVWPGSADRTTDYLYEQDLYPDLDAVDVSDVPTVLGDLAFPDGLYTVNDLCSILTTIDYDTFISWIEDYGGFEEGETFAIYLGDPTGGYTNDINNGQFPFPVFEVQKYETVSQCKDFAIYNRENMWLYDRERNYSQNIPGYTGPFTHSYDSNGNDVIKNPGGGVETNFRAGDWFYESNNAGSVWIYNKWNVGTFITPTASNSVKTKNITQWLRISTDISRYQIEKYTPFNHPLYYRRTYSGNSDKIAIFPNNEKALTVLEGQDLYLRAEILYTPGSSTPTVQWASGDDSIASVEGTETVHGTPYVIINANKAGTTTISATTVSSSAGPGGGLSTVTIKVLPIEINSITLNKHQLITTPGQTYQLFYDEQNNTQQNLKHGVSYKSSNNKVISVDKNGLVTAISSGTAIITATSLKDSSKTDTCAITILNVVDLGLPSGTLWAADPIGGKVSSYGPWKTQGTNFTLNGLGGSEYLNSPLLAICMNEQEVPTKSQFDELLQYCTLSTYRPVSNATWLDLKLTSKVNGNCITLATPRFGSMKEFRFITSTINSGLVQCLKITYGSGSYPTVYSTYITYDTASQNSMSYMFNILPVSVKRED